MTADQLLKEEQRDEQEYQHVLRDAGDMSPRERLRKAEAWEEMKGEGLLRAEQEYQVTKKRWKKTNLQLQLAELDNE